MERVLCQGKEYWASVLPQIHNNRSVRVMHKSSGGTIDGSYWFTLKYIKDRLMDAVTLKPKKGWVIGIFLDTGIGGKTYHSIKWSWVTAREILELLIPVSTHRNIPYLHTRLR